MADAMVAASPQALATRFAGWRALTVRQRKKWLEILLSFEFRNKYDVYDDHQMQALHVKEEGGGFSGFLARTFLGPLRPFRATVSDMEQQPLLALRRPFRFIFHRLEVRSPQGELLGAIQKKWSWIRRIYDIEDGDGRVRAELFGPILKPWTFEIRVEGRMQGAIRKRWGGFAKEMFTDADNFGVDFGDLEDPSLKALAFAATVLIDVVHFERAKN
jgi:uncharacterized protein YxjI